MWRNQHPPTKKAKFLFRQITESDSITIITAYLIELLHVAGADVDGVVAVLELDLNPELSVAHHDLGLGMSLLEVEHLVQTDRPVPGHPRAGEGQELSVQVHIQLQLRGKDGFLTRVVGDELLGIIQNFAVLGLAVEIVAILATLITHPTFSVDPI